MSKTGALIFLVILIIFASIVGFSTWYYSKFLETLKNWDTIKTYINGELKKELMDQYSLSEDEYMQCIVGVWIVANVEAEDIKKLMNLNERSDKEKRLTDKTISKIQYEQEMIRISFTFEGKEIKEVWGRSDLFFIIKLLKDSNLSGSIGETERNVVNAFYEKHKNGLDIFNMKIKSGVLTIVENAIKRLPDIFKESVISS